MRDRIDYGTWAARDRRRRQHERRAQRIDAGLTWLLIVTLLGFAFAAGFVSGEIAGRRRTDAVWIRKER